MQHAPAVRTTQRGLVRPSALRAFGKIRVAAHRRQFCEIQKEEIEKIRVVVLMQTHRKLLEPHAHLHWNPRSVRNRALRSTFPQLGVKDEEFLLGGDRFGFIQRLGGQHDFRSELHGELEIVADRLSVVAAQKPRLLRLDEKAREDHAILIAGDRSKHGWDARIARTFRFLAANFGETEAGSDEGAERNGGAVRLGGVEDGFDELQRDAVGPIGGLGEANEEIAKNGFDERPDDYVGLEFGGRGAGGLVEVERRVGMELEILGERRNLETAGASIGEIVVGDPHDGGVEGGEEPAGSEREKEGKDLAISMSWRTRMSNSPFAISTSTKGAVCEKKGGKKH